MSCTTRSDFKFEELLGESLKSSKVSRFIESEKLDKEVLKGLVTYNSEFIRLVFKKGKVSRIILKGFVSEEISKWELPLDIRSTMTPSDIKSILNISKENEYVDEDEISFFYPSEKVSYRIRFNNKSLSYIYLDKKPGDDQK